MTDRTLLDYASPAQGTESVHAFSQGNTLPLVARPFAMTHWGPQTEEGNRFYKPSARQIQGIRATHQPSPWIGVWTILIYKSTYLGNIFKSPFC